MEFQSHAVSPGDSIGEGWNLIKDDYWTVFSMTLVAMIILVVIGMILGAVNNLIVFAVSSALGMATNGGGGAIKTSAVIVPQLLSMFISLFFNILLGAISGVLFCGIYAGLSRKAATGVIEFSDLFSEFQKFISCLIVATALSLVQFVISLITLFIGLAVGISTFGAGMIMSDGKPNPSIFGGLFLVILLFVLVYLIINLIISALTTFSYPLIAERNLSGAEALGLSIKSGMANIGGLLGLLILLGLMAFAGILVCFVGVLFVAPILIAAIFAAYQRVFGRMQNQSFQAPPPPPSFGNQPGY